MCTASALTALLIRYHLNQEYSYALVRKGDTVGPLLWPSALLTRLDFCVGFHCIPYNPEAYHIPTFYQPSGFGVWKGLF